jgi:hypothetical protein
LVQLFVTLRKIYLSPDVQQAITRHDDQQG